MVRERPSSGAASMAPTDQGGLLIFRLLRHGGPNSATLPLAQVRLNGPSCLAVAGQRRGAGAAGRRSPGNAAWESRVPTACSALASKAPEIKRKRKKVLCRGRDCANHFTHTHKQTRVSSSRRPHKTNLGQKRGLQLGRTGTQDGFMPSAQSFWNTFRITVGKDL